MSLTIERKKFAIIVTLLCFLILNSLGYEFLFSLGKHVYTKSEIQMISFIFVLEFAYTVYAWKRQAGELFSPFFITYIVSVIFCAGQAFCWAFGIEMGELDLQVYIPTIGMEYIGNGLIFTIQALLLFFAGGIISYPKQKITEHSKELSIKNEYDKRAIKVVSTLLLIVSTPCVIVNYINILPSVLMGGYSELYTELNSYSKLGQFIPLISNWFPIALLMKYAVHQESKRMVVQLSVIALFIYIGINLFIGGRSGAVMIVLAFLITKQYYGKKITKRVALPYLGVGYIFLSVLNAIKDIRLLDNRSVISVLESISLTNTFGDFVGELGWSLSSVCWTMKLLATGAGSTLRMGQSYLYALTAIIPNLGFWQEHPAIKADLGLWMQSALGRTTGLGYTFVAEAYANYAYAGIIVALIFGLVLGKLMNKVQEENAKANYKYTFLIIMLITVLLKSFVRSSFSSIMRQLVFTVILIYVLIGMTSNYLMKKGMKNIEKNRYFDLV